MNKSFKKWLNVKKLTINQILSLRLYNYFWCEMIQFHFYKNDFILLNHRTFFNWAKALFNRLKWLLTYCKKFLNGQFLLTLHIKICIFFISDTRNTVTKNILYIPSTAKSKNVSFSLPYFSKKLNASNTLHGKHKPALKVTLSNFTLLTLSHKALGMLQKCYFSWKGLWKQAGMNIPSQKMRIKFRIVKDEEGL